MENGSEGPTNSLNENSNDILDDIRQMNKKRELLIQERTARLTARFGTNNINAIISGEEQKNVD